MRAILAMLLIAAAAAALVAPFAEDREIAFFSPAFFGFMGYALAKINNIEDHLNAKDK